MTPTVNTTPQIHVDTHGNYRHGSLAGSRVDLEQFAGGRAAFLAYCAQIRAELDLGERHGRLAGRNTAAELFDGPEGLEHARQCLADLADGNPDLWLQCPEPHHMHGESYADGYGAGWAAELEHQARLTLAMFADFETVPH